MRHCERLGLARTCLAVAVKSAEVAGGMQREGKTGQNRVYVAMSTQAFWGKN